MRRRGSSAIEFMLVLPVFMTLTFGVIDFTWCLMAWRSVIASAQVGARAGARVSLSDEPTDTALAEATRALESSWPAGSLAAEYDVAIVDGEVIRVEISAAFTPLVGLLETPSRLHGMQQMLVELE